jgi:hypothetical protein
MNWEDIGTGLPFLSTIEKLFVYNGKIIAVTSQGLWQRNISEIVVGIENQSGSLPQAYKLYQNYPNPFNPTTKIKFEAPLAPPEGGMQIVSLKIYDLLGREVFSLFSSPSGRIGGATYEITWDASNFPSGIYYYRLEAGNYYETKKMILLK